MGVRQPALEGLVTAGTQATEGVSGTRDVGAPRCRSCGATLTETFADLGTSPLANGFLTEEQLGLGEPFYPLRVLVCGSCLLVQLPPVVSPAEIFSDYAYFSSFSDSFVAHARDYAEQMTERLGLDSSSRVVEIASNDGYLLRHFVERGVPVLGIEPAGNVAAAAEEAGVATRIEFFTRDLAETLLGEGEAASLVIANNVLAHVPDLNGFVEGMRLLLAPGAFVTVEFPHLLRLMELTAFDMIYHEHLFYFSLLSVEQVFRRAGLQVVDVEEVETHGGSLRVHASRDDEDRQPDASVAAWRSRELAAGLDRIETYTSFEERVRRSKLDLLEFLVGAKREGRSIAAYGAAAKATTLLNYCGIRRDFVDYVVDRSPHKQGRYIPGTHVPIRGPEEVGRTRPDYLLLLAWNLAREIMEQMSFVKDFGCRFVVPIPEPAVIG